LCGPAAGAEVERSGSGWCSGPGKSFLGHFDPGTGALHTGSPTFSHHDIESSHAVVWPKQTRIDRHVPQQGIEDEPQGLSRRRHAVAHR